jgi:hypothetical protein
MGPTLLGFKRFRNAAVTIIEIELADKIRKGQFDTPKLSLEKARAENFGRQLWQRRIGHNNANSYFSHAVCTTAVATSVEIRI